MREIESDMPIDAVIVLFDNDGYGGREGLDERRERRESNGAPPQRICSRAPKMFP